MRGVGKRNWVPEITLLVPDPYIRPFDLELLDTDSVEGFYFEVLTEHIRVQTLYQFNELLARLCDGDVLVTHLGTTWSTICILSNNRLLVIQSLDDATMFFNETITWEEHPREP